MERNLFSWYSPALNKDMPIATYGHLGTALLLIPTAAADYLEYERFQLIDSLQPFIEQGKIKVFSINSVNDESWMNDHIDPHQKMIRHKQFNEYVYNEVVSYIKLNSNNGVPVITCGASFGALHSANLFFRRPDIINGCVCLSGIYELTEYTNGYYDDDVYFNSPMQYMPNLSDHTILEQIRSSEHIHLLTGSGPYEDPDHARRFAKILHDKGIWYELDIWGIEWSHDWPTWRAMLPHYLTTRF